MQEQAAVELRAFVRWIRLGKILPAARGRHKAAPTTTRGFACVGTACLPKAKAHRLKPVPQTRSPLARRASSAFTAFYMGPTAVVLARRGSLCWGRRDEKQKPHVSPHRTRAGRELQNPVLRCLRIRRRGRL